jgi:alginate O-acetyltransferase complex protein AlgI
MRIRNTFIIFIVSGFWHGANWTFIIWGLLNALYIMPSIIFNTNRNNLEIVAKGKHLPTIKEFASIAITFTLTVFAWIFFRAADITHAFDYIAKIFSRSILTTPHFAEMKKGLVVFILVILFITIEWIGREQQYAIANIGNKMNRPFRWALYSLLLFAIGMFMQTEETPFIYFQF